jgi:organic radical activating enzyme
MTLLPGSKLRQISAYEREQNIGEEMLRQKENIIAYMSKVAHPSRIKWYGKSLLLRRGVNLAIHPTTRCNQNCHYCPRLMPTGKIVPCQESTLEEWKEFIILFTQSIKVNEIFICGGEPTLVNYIAELANWILDMGFHLILYSNLYRGDRLLAIKKTYRFKIQATFHHKDNPRRFLEQYNDLIKKHRVDVDEISDGLPKVFKFSKLKPQFDKADFQRTGFGLRVSPNREVFHHCFDMFAAGKL